MNCHQCGKPLDPNLSACPWCGAAVDRGLPAAAPERGAFGKSKGAGGLRLPWKWMALGLGALTVLIALVSLILGAGGGSLKAVDPKDRPAAFQSGQAVLVVRNGQVLHELPGTLLEQKTDLYGAAALLISDSGVRRLYHVSGKTVTAVSAAFPGGMQLDDVTLSPGGASICWFEPDGSGFILYRQSGDKRESFPGAARVNPVFSPDGAWMAFTEINGTTGCLVNAKGKKTVLAENMSIVALSRKGKLVYYTRGSGLYVRSGDVEVQLTGGTATKYSYWFNAERSEIILSFDGRSYLSKNGGERSSLTGSALLDVILPEGLADVASFEDAFLLFDDGLYYRGSSDEPVLIVESASDISLSAKGDVLLYLNANRYWRLTDKKKLVPVKLTLDEAVLRSRLSSDGKLCYFLTESNRVFAIKSSGKMEQLGDRIHSVAFSPDASSVYMLSDFSDYIGTLYVSVNAGKRQKIGSIGDVAQLIELPSGVYAYTNKEGETASLFHTVNGTGLKRVAYDVAFKTS